MVSLFKKKSTACAKVIFHDDDEVKELERGVVLLEGSPKGTR